MIGTSRIITKGDWRIATNKYCPSISYATGIRTGMDGLYLQVLGSVGVHNIESLVKAVNKNDGRLNT